MAKGMFITIEGTDGSGKTTQIKRMEKYLEQKGYKVVLTREPGGTVVGEKIRSIILDPLHKEMSEMAEMLLYTACRAQLISEVIQPEVAQGSIVICDRFVDSTYAYQGFGREIDLKMIADVNRAALDGVTPDITFFFDISPKFALCRRIAATGTDRIENEEMEFHMKVYSGYKKLASLYPERIKTIDSERTVEEVFEDVRKWLDKLLE